MLPAKRLLAALMNRNLYCSDTAISDLASICKMLAHDERNYRDVGYSCQSKHKQDKVQYDHALCELEYVGNR